jgi:hypothetical protein
VGLEQFTYLGVKTREAADGLVDLTIKFNHNSLLSLQLCIDVATIVFQSGSYFVNFV